MQAVECKHDCCFTLQNKVFSETDALVSNDEICDDKLSTRAAESGDRCNTQCFMARSERNVPCPNLETPYFKVVFAMPTGHFLWDGPYMMSVTATNGWL